MKKTLLVMLLLLSASLSVWAVKVEGIVYDEKKEQIIGATVQIKETKSGTVTDVNGKFQINVSDPTHTTLIVSYLGYKKKFIQLDGKTMITVFMEQDNNSLDEVVVVGYGSMKKSDITGSMVSVRATQEESMSNTSFDKMLQGKAAGLVINTSSNAPGGGVNIHIRGTSSLRGNNSPLYVIDGNIIDVDQTPDAMASGTSGGNALTSEQNPLSAISPQDIENIEILKDASATAIYGSRGANGVILITTKQGNTGKPVVTFTSTLTTSRLAKRIPMLNTSDYIDFWNIINPSLAKTLDSVDPVDWQDYTTRNAFSQNYRASVAAKSGKTTYYLSAGYMKNEGIIQKTGISQYDIRLNLTQEISKAVSLTTTTSYSDLNTSMTSGTDKLSSVKTSIISQMISFHPYKGIDSNVYDENLTGPNAWFTDYDDDSRDKQFSTNATLNVNMASWLKLQLKGGVVDRSKTRSIWTGNMIALGAQTNGKAGISTLKSTNYNTEAMLLFNKKINKSNSLNGTLGIVYSDKSMELTSLTAENFYNHDLRAKGITKAQTQYPFIYTETGEQMFSALGRAVYNFKDKYVLTGTFRADASSKFNGKNKWGYFPSFAFAWRTKEESFLKDVEAINNLKVRLGWGQVGNQAISPYQTMLSYSDAFYTSADGSIAKGIIPSLIANPDLIWETSEQYNAGIDISLLDQRINVTVDIFDKYTKDLLQQKAISYSSGFATMWVNDGRIQNKGIEVTLDTKVIDSKNFKFNLGGNISVVRSNILSLGMPSADFGALTNQTGYYGDQLGNNNNTKFSPNIFLVGNPIGQFIGYQTNGIIQDGSTVIFKGTTLTAGNINLVDQQGGNVVDEQDMVILGDPNPKFVYAITSNLTYKDLSLSMAFNGVYGNQIINANLIDQTDVSNGQKNVLYNAYHDAWDATNNPTGRYPKLGSAPLGVLTDRIIEDGSYLRLSNITLAYKLKLPKLNLFNSLSISATMNNVFCLTKYSGYDPDVNSFGGNVGLTGIDMASYPSSRSIIFGLTANF